ncbi:exo-rhamnogalacturonan lyase family protein [Pseudoduganella albidiflava]|uniref:Tat pathway signal sequence domain protein n=1 Tax=Pseudoduganella albidiflava TaxID=321983 RepID=A0AA88C284_9BURK|nr:DUF6250 domain-containing protein [Pseudoduganella albidiflava]GGY35462.1 hypothetical protein GCM10007387_16890 [Pseudoduganella albidiflava]
MDRRKLLKLTALLAGAPTMAMSPARAAADTALAPPETTTLGWLDGAPPASFTGATFGVPWPQGQVPRGSGFTMRAAGGAAPPLQSWPLAWWPDGSIKWSAHAIGAGEPAASYGLQPGPAVPAEAGMARREGDGIVVDTGKLRARVPGKGGQVLAEVALAGHTLLRGGELVLLTDGVDDGEDGEDGDRRRRRWQGEVAQAEIEQDGPVRTVLKLTGTHRAGDGPGLLPFTLRLEFHRGSEAIRLLHTFVVDVDPARLDVRGIGLRFGTALDGAPHDRHVRFTSAAGGVFAESVRGLTGLRRDVGDDNAALQVAGLPLPPVEQLPKAVRDGLQYVPAFGDYRLLQPNADGFTIAKRTAKGHGWIPAGGGTRAGGTAYLGGAKGGVAFGVRNFWQSHPGQIDITGAAGDAAAVTLWLWAPEAPAMQLRFFHDGMGQDTHAKQRAALDITYEDYEPGFASPYGIARTSELELQLLPATPTAAGLAAIGQRIAQPPRLMATPGRLHAAGVFSEYWAPAGAPAGTPAGRGGARAKALANRLQTRLAQLFDYYRGQVEQRRWYGFWDYGDVMHTYDARRHQWRYDVGGFAWDNSELSTDIWLWHYFLHSGRADAFRLAEAMTRHTGEVDVHHIGPFSPLGTRHGVQHWGDSAKQLRISTAINRRFMYYLTADERIGDLLVEQQDAVRRLRDIAPGRKIGQQPAGGANEASVGFGTDWGAIAGAWFTAWERTGDKAWRDKLLASMRTIAAQPKGFFTGSAVMDLDTGAFRIAASDKIAVSHLSAVFGLTEICAELLRTLPEPAFRAAWLQYCRLYNATPEAQKAELGQALGPLNLSQGHARLLGYAAVQASGMTERQALIREAWRLFDAGKAGLREADFAVRRVSRPAVLDDIDEAPRISTNGAAQWGLGALGLLALDARAAPAGTLLVRDDFRTFDARRWRVEAEQGDPREVVTVRNGALVLDTRGGLTVWLTQPLDGHYEIAYTCTVLDEGQPGDRVSDMNMFWQARMARPLSGKLADYDRVPMFYAGIGGNHNATTRFRRYDGSGERRLLQEYTDSPYLLKGNHPYRIRIVVDGGGTRLYVDGVQYFASRQRVGAGLFGFRTTLSRQRITDFAVFRLADPLSKRTIVPKGSRTRAATSG